MTEPFIFMNTTAIKEGRLEGWVKYFAEFAEHIEAEEPRLLHFATYVNEAGTEQTIVQVHPDVDSMVFHLGVLGDHGHDVSEYLDFTRARSQIHGAPSADLLQQVRSYGIPVTLSTPAGGFSRLASP